MVTFINGVRRLFSMISVVIPVKNEVGNVALLTEKIVQVLFSLHLPFEIIFVDDGSTDGTVRVLQEIKRRHAVVRVLELRRNFGKAIALQAGFSHAGGDVIFTMDGDLQDDPVDIPRFLEKLGQGFDLVSGWKVKRKDPFSKTFPSRFFNWLTSCVTGVRLHDFNCGFKVYRRDVTKSLFLYGELHRYIPALAAWKGFRVGELPVLHHARRSGRSKYGVSRLFKGLFDLVTVRFLTQYRDRPLHFFGSLGLLLFGFGFVAGLYLTFLWYVEITIWNRPLLIFTVLLLILGVQFFFFGLIAEMIVALRTPDVGSMIKKEY